MSPLGADLTMDASPLDEAERRVVEARMRLRERWRARTLATRARSDPRPQGSGPPNRHGMPQLPPGQKRTEKWPVLDLGRQPDISREEWRLSVDGLCERPAQLDWQAFQQLEQVEDQSDFHCVTGWSRLDMRWRGVRLSELAAWVGVQEDATHLVCHGYDGYSTNLPLEEAFKEDVLLVYEAEGLALSREHGGPVRMITPQLYAWKGTKWICRLEFRKGDCPGYWERNGYSNTAHPWQEDRYNESAWNQVPPGLGLGAYLGPMLRWLASVLVVSCLLLLVARHWNLPHWALPIKMVSCLAAFGAIPYALRQSVHTTAIPDELAEGK